MIFEKLYIIITPAILPSFKTVVPFAVYVWVWVWLDAMFVFNIKNKGRISCSLFILMLQATL